jgi:phosphoribosylformylglycinamidine synthase
MTPYELLLSESQERMLIVAAKGREPELQRIFARWELDAVSIGEVIKGGELVVRHRGDRVAHVPIEALAEGPVYEKPVRGAGVAHGAPGLRSAVAARAARWRRGAARAARLADDRVQAVGLPPVRPAGRDQHAGAAGLRRRGAAREGHAPRARRVDRRQRAPRVPRPPPRRGDGGVRGGAERLVCGGQPLGVTDCMNFGSPERPDILWQFAEAIEGIAEACRALELPVVGGNVSLYNETSGAAILPTPIIGVVGMLEDAGLLATQWFKGAGERIALLGPEAVSLGGSEYLWTRHGGWRGRWRRWISRPSGACRVRCGRPSVPGS